MSDGANASAMRKCPICGKPADAKYRPFCSRRCADVDLNRWFSGRYVIASAPEEDEDEASLPALDRPPS